MSVSQFPGAQPLVADDAAPGGTAGLAGPTGAMLIVLALTVVGVIFRVVVAQQSFFGDELATYWIITTRGFGALISALYATHDEITPPLFFVGAWITAHVGHSPILIRAPSLIAGTLTIPAVYWLGVRTVGRRAGLLAAALTALSPFMIYYSAEARAYALMTVLVIVSTIALLQAIDTVRARWWTAYAVFAAGAFYTHYTCAFYLLAQFGWALWAHPALWRRTLTASLGAAVLVIPWAPAVINAQRSPTTKIMSALSPFTPQAVLHYLEHWSIGYPYTAAAGLTSLPGGLALIMLAVATVLALGSLTVQVVCRHRRAALASIDPRVILVLVLLLAVPVGEALVSLLSAHIFGVRNLASAWPALVLVCAAAAMACGPIMRPLVAALALACFAFGAIKMLQARFQRPDYAASAAFVDRIARPGDVVIDETRAALTPGPLTDLDVFLTAKVPIFRAGIPQENVHPFGFSDPAVSLSTAIREAVRAAGDGRIIVVSAIPTGSNYRRVAATRVALPVRYGLLEYRVNPGIVGTSVQVYAMPGA